MSHATSKPEETGSIATMLPLDVPIFRPMPLVAALERLFFTSLPSGDLCLPMSYTSSQERIGASRMLYPLENDLAVIHE